MLLSSICNLFFPLFTGYFHTEPKQALSGAESLSLHMPFNLHPATASFPGEQKEDSAAVTVQLRAAG